MHEGEHVSIAAWYRWFAANEAEGRSQLWAELGRQIADDAEVLAFLTGLPPSKRQPNLLLASYRSLFGTPVDWTDFRDHLLAETAAVAARMRERSTQTNEPGRCATLVPVLASLPQPLAILEVGAAAGLCLLPEQYGYDYGRRRLVPPDTIDPPLFPCRVSSNTPVPDRLPEIAWRAGLDLNPLDVTDAEQMLWLETLVWPGQELRQERLRKAIAIAKANPPRVVRGSLENDLEKLLAQAPPGLTTVVFHSAVLSYVPQQDARTAFADRVMSLADYYIANESPSVLPQIVTDPVPPSPGSFLLSCNRIPVAWTDPHGASIVWMDDG
jgi:hypothetical protein